MCPLRVILIFLSATLAGFFVLRNLKAQPQQDKLQEEETQEEEQQLPLCKKIGSAISIGLWTCVDMASGRYLWRNLVVGSSGDVKKKC